MAFNQTHSGEWTRRHLPNFAQSGRACAVALVYLILGCSWILVTDALVFQLDPGDISLEDDVSVVKGLFFVFMSAALIYLLTSFLFARILRQSMELNAVFSKPELGSVQFDSAGRINSFTPSVCKMLGYSEKEFRQFSVMDLTHPDDRREVRELIQEFVSGGKNHATCSYRLLTKHGKPCWVEKNIQLLTRHKEFCQFISTVQGVNKRVEAELKLKEALREKEALINNTDDLIWSIDTEMRLVSFNRAYADLIYRLEGIRIEKGMEAIMPKFGDEIAERWRGYYIRALQGETFSVLEENRQESGKYYSAILFSPIREGETVVGASCIARDVTELKRTQLDLAARSERLQIAQSIAKLGDWIIDPPSGEIYWSQGMYAIHERDPSLGPVPLEETLNDYLNPEDADRLAKAIDAALNQHEPYDLLLTLILPTGRKTQIRAMALPGTDSFGNDILRGIVQDVTEQQRLERELSRHRDQLKTVVDNLPGVLFQYKRFADGTDKILYQSEGSEDIWGHTPEEVCADNHLVWRQIDPDDLGKVMESIRESQESLGPWNCLWRSHHPNGKDFWHEGFGIPRKEADGGILWNSIILNVTDRVIAERKLREHEEYWHLLTRHASDGIVICDAKGHLDFFNEPVRSWVGEVDPKLSTEDWAETYGLYTLEGSRHLQAEEIDLVRALNGETISSFRFMVKRPDQPVRYLESSGGPLSDQNGQMIGAMVLIRDITERYRHEFEITDAIIEAAESERERIASDLHDSVTQDLSIVSLNLNNFQLENPSVAESGRLLKAKAYLEKAVEDTRAISHQIIPASVKDLGLIKAVGELVEDINRTSGLDIAFTYNADCRMNQSEELDLFRIVQEALQNILKHARAAHGTVDIFRKEDSLEISIYDDGVGFKATEKDSDKIGIGLRTMKNRALKWGGDFIVHTEPGNTTVFTKIPIKDPT